MAHDLYEYEGTSVHHLRRVGLKASDVRGMFTPFHSKEPKIRARMAKTTEELIKDCMENAKRERDRKEKVERGEGSELEHVPLKI